MLEFTPVPNDLPKGRRRGAPWRLDFFEDIDQTPHSARSCGWPASLYEGDPNTPAPPPPPK
jgi:hypothetical protein